MPCCAGRQHKLPVQCNPQPSLRRYTLVNQRHNSLNCQLSMLQLAIMPASGLQECACRPARGRTQGQVRAPPEAVDRDVEVVRRIPQRQLAQKGVQHAAAVGAARAAAGRQRLVGPHGLGVYAQPVRALAAHLPARAAAGCARALLSALPSCRGEGDTQLL